MSDYAGGKGRDAGALNTANWRERPQAQAILGPASLDGSATRDHCMREVRGHWEALEPSLSPTPRGLLLPEVEILGCVDVRHVMGVVRLPLQ